MFTVVGTESHFWRGDDEEKPFKLLHTDYVGVYSRMLEPCCVNLVLKKTIQNGFKPPKHVFSLSETKAFRLKMPFDKDEDICRLVADG